MPSIQEPTFLILSALARAPLYGYALIEEVEALSAGRVRLRAGTLYAALDRLTEAGLVTVDHEEICAGRLRRYYRLTETGVATLDAEVQRMRGNARVAAARLRSRSAKQLRPDAANA